MRRSLGLAAVILLAGFGVACTSQPAPKPTSAQPPEIHLIAPDAPVILGEEVRIIVEVFDDDGPVRGEQVTFDIVSGAAAYPAGFDTDVTDDLGAATSLDLRTRAAGTVTVRVATGSQATNVEIDVVE